MSELDDRLRRAFGALGADMESGIRSPGAAAARSVAVRRRRRVRVAGAATAAAVALAGGWGMRYTLAGGGTQVAAPSCAPVDARAFLTADAGPMDTSEVGRLLSGAPEVVDRRFVSRDEQWERFKRQFSDAPDLVAATKPDSLAAAWAFTLRCAGDFPALRDQLRVLAGVADVVCDCDKPTSGRPGRSESPVNTPASEAPPTTGASTSVPATTSSSVTAPASHFVSYTPTR